MSAQAAASEAPTFRQLQPGDPGPWFRQRATGNPDYSFDTVAGRYILICFFGTAADEAGRAANEAVLANRALFDDGKLAFFGVSVDPADEAEARVGEAIPGIRYFWDADRRISRLYGAAPTEAAGPREPYRRFWLLLNPTLRVRAVFPFNPDGSDRDVVMAALRALPPVERFAGFRLPPPVLVLPDVFEPDLCRRLIGLYEDSGGEESGFMREVDGKTVLLSDHGHKRRRDCIVEDETLIRVLQDRVKRRINPEIEKVHYFRPTRMERYIVSCYAAEEGGHFRAHRDNTTKGTAHRRFAVSINLNAEFEGGEVGFPEYGPGGFKAPPGGAVVFSCTLLHAVSKVTAGRRYAFLPFLYDEAAARLREENLKFLGNAPSPG